ncbi:MAG: YkgJ family cysteine cluster protein [Nitrospiraceae bacterium]|nr:MAG: YkgJ family cysteine cluster protein [Nitrospiraceae bacterium]
MKETKKIIKLMKSECGQCTACCRELFLEVTDADILRLAEHTGIPADKLVKLYSRADIDCDEESDWVSLSYGKRALGLNKRRNGDCIFLSSSNTCSAYEARPMTCRIFPLSVVYDDDDEIADVEISDVILDKSVPCKHRCARGTSFRTFMTRAKKAQRENDRYIEKIDSWNTRKTKGNKNDFLAFLGLRVSNT